jgi:T5SS/PEP-CTERM-associated repeat protein
MPRCNLTRVALLVALGWTSPAQAVDFFWVGPGLGGPGGNFRNSNNWTFTPPPFPLVPAPGGASDTANFDLGRTPENRYTVTNVHGENNRLIVHDDSLTLVVADVNIGAATDYVLSNDTTTSPSLTIGVALGDVADVILAGDGGRAVVSTQATTIGRAPLSTGILTVDNELRLIGAGDLVVGESGIGTLTIQNEAVVASDRGLLGVNEGPGYRASGNVLVTGTGSTWNIDEALIVGVEGTGTLSILNGGTISSGFGFVSGNSIATVDGAGSAWTINGGLAMFQGSNATLNIQNGGSVTAGLNGMNTMTANSSTEVTLDSGGVLDVRTTIDMNTGAFNFLSGKLHVATFDDNLVNQGGTLAPGNPDQSAGSTNITGNYTHQSAATLQIEIGGTAQGTQHDYLNVEGIASMAGALELVLINDFMPAPDDEFVVFNTETLWLGAFSNVADGDRLATTGGLGSFLVHYGPTSSFDANQVVLSDFLPTLLGDYNGDGTVNAADYVVWRKNDNTPASYNTWRMHFGETVGNGSGAATAADAAVPEPASLAMFVLAAAVAMLRLPRRRVSPIEYSPWRKRASAPTPCFWPPLPLAYLYASIVSHPRLQG